MTKPKKPGEMRNVKVNAISLVGNPANGESFKIYKSADPEPQETSEPVKSGEPEQQEDKAPEVVEKNERGLFSILKAFFTGTNEPVEKGAVADTVNAKLAGRRLYEAFDALTQVLGISRYIDADSKPETDSTKILSAIDDFRNVAIEILIGKEVVKSGRKISTPRLTKLKNIQAMLSDVLSELDETDETSKETEDVSKEEVKKAVDEAMKAANVEEVIKNALAPVIERIEKIENARGFSNRVQEDSPVSKGANDFWEGIF